MYVMYEWQVLALCSYLLLDYCRARTGYKGCGLTASDMFQTVDPFSRCIWCVWWSAVFLSCHFTCHW